jgi:hypothetical protein
MTLPGHELTRSEAPVNHLIEYHVTNISTGFMTKTPYMGFPNDEIDGMWEDLYQCKRQIFHL